MPFVDLQSYDESSSVQGAPQRVLGSGGAAINTTPGYHRYHQTFTTSANARFVHIEQGIEAAATPKPGIAEALFDDVVISTGRCPDAGP